MGVFDDSTWEQIVPFMSFVLMFGLMWGIDYCYKMVGIDTRAQMKKRLFYLSPASPAFGIWSVIFAGLLIFTILNCFNEFAGTIDPLWFSVLMLSLVAWFVVFPLEIYSLSSLILLGSLVAGFQVITEIPQNKAFVELGFGYIQGIFTGWLLTAAYVNCAIFIQQRGLNGEDSFILGLVFVNVLFYSHFVITLLMDKETLTYCWPISLVLLWSLHWILYKSEEVKTKGENLTYLTGVFLSCCIVVWTVSRVILQYDIVSLNTDLNF